jgi:two-component sensor histidine kinase
MVRRPQGSSISIVSQLPDTRAPIADVFITDELKRRVSTVPDYLTEKLALQDLARHMSDHPKQVLPRLVKLAMEICEAESAGVSILKAETKEFRWFGLAGVLATFEGATTPRNHSPCGVCLDTGEPVLMDRPERVYEWIREANITVPEVLLVPLNAAGLRSIGTLWVVSNRPGHFHGGHARVMTELSTFAAMALRMIQTEDQLNVALQTQEVLAREMSHRVKNLFALAASMIRLSKRSAATKDELADVLAGRMQALADANALVRRQFGDGAPASVNLDELIRRILQPHGYARSSVAGPALPVGERATNNIALIFHELATNAAKYGALSSESGSIAVDWTVDDEDIVLTWKEAGGPVTKPPTTTGFGSRLVTTTVQSVGGDVHHDWASGGLSTRIRLPLPALKA